jgi:hypothetical protein
MNTIIQVNRDSNGEWFLYNFLSSEWNEIDSKVQFFSILMKHNQLCYIGDLHNNVVWCVVRFFAVYITSEKFEIQWGLKGK